MITIDFEKLNIPSKATILDIGCGEGRHTGAAYEREGVVAIGADLNFDDLLKAKERLEFHDEISAHGNGSWHLSVSDITCMPFKNDEFDVVICSEVLEHIPEDKKAIEELIRIVKPGGDLIVSVPRAWPETICWWLSEEYHTVKNGHIRIYNADALTHMIESSGVIQWTHHYAHSLHVPYWWLKCLVGPSCEDNAFVNLYHRLLTWDIMKKPFLTQFADKLLNPILGKSVVLYFKKY